MTSEKLGITQSMLDNDIRWHEIVEKLVQLHEHGIHRVAVSDHLSEHDVVSRILRRENYMVALINKVMIYLIFFNWLLWILFIIEILWEK